MPTKPGWTSAYMIKETKQRYHDLVIVGERLEDTFTRVAQAAELLKQAFPTERDVFKTAQLLVESAKFREEVINRLRPIQRPNEAIIDAIDRLIAQKTQTPQNIKSETSTRTVI